MPVVYANFSMPDASDSSNPDRYSSSFMYVMYYGHIV